MASIYKRDNTWWVKYYSNGKLVRRSLKTTNKRIAERERMAIEAGQLEPHRQAPDEKNPTVEAFWEAYLKWASTHLRERTIEIQSLFWRQLIKHTGALRLGDIRKSDIESFKAWKKGQEAADRSVNNALKDIQSIYNHAIKLGLYTGLNPAKDIDRFKIPVTMPEFHTEKELKHLLKEATTCGQTAQWVVLLGGWVGLRKTEIVNARWEWFVFSDKEPMVRIKQFGDFKLKDHEERVIPMSKLVFESLFPHRKESGFLFESNHESEGKWRYRFDPRKSLVTALKKAGLTTSDPFQRLRHTFGSLHAQKGVSIFKVSKWLGHSSVQVTERHYAGLQAYDSDIDSF